jgi:hypothetical protein
MILIPILIYVLILLLLFIFKPSIMFDKNGNLRKYSSKNMMTLDIIYPIFALLSYYIYIIIKIIAK